MRRTKIYSVIGMLALLLLGACSLHEEDDIFGDSSANRISDALKSYKEVLVSAENGWVMQYYPSSNQPFGGYNLLVSFKENGEVTVAGEIADSEASVTSLYTLKQSAGPVLTFDSYNKIMHFFSEPLGGQGGEFEFTVMSATPEKVVLSGRKSQNTIVLTPMTKDVTWSSYLESVQEVQKSIFLGTFLLTVDGKEVGEVVQNSNVFTLTYTAAGSLGGVETIPFIYTNEGIKFYNPITINGVTMSTFKADADNVSFVCTDAGVNAKFEAFYPTGYHFYNELVGVYTMGGTTVNIAANPDGKTYSITGFTKYGTVQAEYARSMGALSITSQYVGIALNKYYAYLCLCNDFYVTWQEGTGMIGVNSVESPLTITFEDNGVWGTDVGDTFIMYAFTSQPPTSSGVAGWLEQYEDPIVLVKQD